MSKIYVPKNLNEFMDILAVITRKYGYRVSGETAANMYNWQYIMKSDIDVIIFDNAGGIEYSIIAGSDVIEIMNSVAVRYIYASRINGVENIRTFPFVNKMTGRICFGNPQDIENYIFDRMTQE